MLVVCTVNFKLPNRLHIYQLCSLSHIPVLVRMADRRANHQDSEMSSDPGLLVCGRHLSQTFGAGHFEQLQFQFTHVKTIDKVEGPRDIAFATTGEIAVCEWRGHCVSVFDASCKRLRSFGNTEPKEQKLDAPRGLAISSDNTVFVAANHCVKKFTLDGHFIASVGSQGSGSLEFETPFSIAYNTTNNKIYVCDMGNDRIVTLNHDLTLHGSFGSSECGALKQPKGISCDNKGNVLVADRGNNRILVFDANGRYISAIMCTMPGEELQTPLSVSVGPDNFMYVVEYESQRISIFDRTGKYIKSFNDKEGKFFQSTYCVAVSNEGYVYISDADGNKIHVFK